MQHAEHAHDRADPALGVMDEGDHAEFDDLVPAVVEPGRLHIDHKCDPFAWSEPVGGIDGTWLEAAQDAVVVVLVEDPRRPLRIESARQAPASRGGLMSPRLPERGTVVLVGVVEQVGLGER